VKRLFEEDPELMKEEHQELNGKLKEYLEKSYDKLNL